MLTKPGGQMFPGGYNAVEWSRAPVGRSVNRLCTKLRAGRHNIMRRLFRFKRKGDESWVSFCTKTTRLAWVIRKKQKIPFLSDVIAESMWRTMGGSVSRDRMQYWKPCGTCSTTEVCVGGKYKRSQHDGGPEQPHQMKTQMEVAES